MSQAIADVKCIIFVFNICATDTFSALGMDLGLALKIGSASHHAYGSCQFG